MIDDEEIYGGLDIEESWSGELIWGVDLGSWSGVAVNIKQVGEPAQVP